MKCYILTYYQYDNYGTRLQNYALKSVLETLNINTYTIYLKNFKSIISNVLKDCISYLPCVTTKQKLWINNRKKRKIFEKFNKSLNFYEINFNNLKKINDNNSIFIVGSDQVWSPNHLMKVKYATDLYFLTFVTNNNKYAYAPSFGTDNIPENMKEIYESNIKSFSKISVREEAGQRILNDLLIPNVEIMPDPVFLLTKNDWEKSINNNVKIKEKYILTYFLGKIDDDRNKEFINLANKMNCKIVNICGNYYNDKDYLPSPDEFINLINNAEIVFTDSFHAAAFSIIMNTEFFVIKRNDVKQFSRLETLLKKYCLENCIINDNYQIKNVIKTSINKDKINERLIAERNKGMKFLQQIIDCNKKGDNNDE